jgi:hypothetical protein
MAMVSSVNLGIYGGISICFFMRYRNSEFWNRNSDFLTLQTTEFKKKIQPESLESKTESEFSLRWESQKSEPKIGIPNQVPTWKTYRAELFHSRPNSYSGKAVKCM